MSSQPIMVPGGEKSHHHESQSSSVGHSNDLRTMTPPTSRSFNNPSGDERRPRQGSVNAQSAQLSKLPSSESLTANVNIPGPPLSPGLSAMGESTLKIDTTTDKGDGKLTRKESYKAQRKNYRIEKKRVANELLSSLKDPTVVVMSDWLKVRGTLKSWTKLWCILKPGLLLLYKSPKIKSSHWVGTVLLNTCQVIERPSKKDGFCFKLFHPLEQSIWAPRGPEKEAMRAVVQPLPTSHLIFRAPSQAAGKCWLDALELSLRCSSLIVRSTSILPRSPQHDATTTHETQWSEADYEKHFDDHDYKLDESLQINLSRYIPPTPTTPQRRLLSCPPSHYSPGNKSPASKSLCPSPTPVFQQLCHAVAYWEKHLIDLDDISQPENGVVADAEISGTDSDSEGSVKEEEITICETPYLANENEFLGSAGEVVAELPDEQKSLIWFLLKQVRPGMDLSKVVLPTFILEPRSFLEKLADSYYHADLLSQAVLEDDAFTRMKGVVKWYLSGFYKKPQGLKKPYNPLLGETFRCYWQHPNGSRTFYLAEQISHHPPISGFYVTNRQDGFTISSTIIAKSKFYGNSTSAVLDGAAVLTMLPRGEDYSMTIPYAHCKGIVMGTLSMELGGKINIICEKTGYHTELEFKLKPFLGGAEQMNQVVGRIKLGKETLGTISGYWDGQINIVDKRTGQESVLFSSTPEVRRSRLKKYTVPIESQNEWESQKLWLAVTQAINNDDQIVATEAKTALEEAQRERAKERKLNNLEWIPKYFVQDIITGNWIYRHADIRPWDPRNDVVQYEQDYIVRTKTRHKTPIMRTGSIVSADPQSQYHEFWAQHAESRSSLSVLKSSKRQLSNNLPLAENPHDSASSSEAIHSDSSQSVGKRRRSAARMMHSLKEVESQMAEHGEKLNRIQRSIEQLAIRQRTQREQNYNPSMIKSCVDTIVVIAIVYFVQYIMKFFNHTSDTKDT
ncbi:oxysterol-binding protein-related protein 8 isoform X3 [Cotesia glomerata]|uniref:oxysterol-binding protein-related protein 8 isoform X3 n=1 Tax=Cotesia glomerata TaxID=32391 RepID=UPI001D00E001|nr:oxysterol-binding protein-related protein 8 isoform X3 [Cotesia glomerata]